MRSSVSGRSGRDCSHRPNRGTPSVSCCVPEPVGDARACLAGLVRVLPSLVRHARLAAARSRPIRAMPAASSLGEGAGCPRAPALSASRSSSSDGRPLTVLAEREPQELLLFYAPHPEDGGLPPMRSGSLQLGVHAYILLLVRVWHNVTRPRGCPRRRSRRSRTSRSYWPKIPARSTSWAGVGGGGGVVVSSSPASGILSSIPSSTLLWPSLSSSPFPGFPIACHDPGSS